MRTITLETDERAMRPAATTQWQAAERDAFVRAQCDRLFAWFVWLTGDRHAADDLTQETFAAFWASLARTRVRNAEAWLFRIARNRWRKWRRDRRTTVELAADVAGPPLTDDSSDEQTRELIEAVRQLPPVYREAVTLRFWCDHSHKQIAAIVGVPAALVRWRVHHACKLLRHILPNPEGLEGGTP